MGEREGTEGRERDEEFSERAYGRDGEGMECEGVERWCGALRTEAREAKGGDAGEGMQGEGS